MRVILDLYKVQEAMDWLGDTPGGDQALKGLSDGIAAFFAANPTELNKAEERYIMERLMQNRRLEGQDEEFELEDAEVVGFSSSPDAGLYPTLTGVQRVQLQPHLQNSFRSVNWGFQIKASIPVFQSGFSVNP